MREWSKFLLLTVLAVTVVACQTTTEPTTQPESTDTRGTVETPQDIVVNPFDDPTNPLSKRTIYFDFDSSEISSADREIITAHAEYLASHPGATVVLEGHADERGTREYNIALGERRAKAVSKLMLLQGVAQSQVDVISYGEERPVDPGHDESAWSQNRRVEIIYSGN